jgi:hypothetical protein
MQTDTPRSNAATARARRAYVLALWRLQADARPREVVFMLNELATQCSIAGPDRAGTVGVFLASAMEALGEMVENAYANQARVDAYAEIAADQETDHA